MIPGGNKAENILLFSHSTKTIHHHHHHHHEFVKASSFISFTKFQCMRKPIINLIKTCRAIQVKQIEKQFLANIFQFIQNFQGNEKTGLDPVFTRLTVKRGVSKLTIAVKETSIKDYHILRFEIYGFRAGNVITLNLFSCEGFLSCFSQYSKQVAR